jgi:hypothetical protein
MLGSGKVLTLTAVGLVLLGLVMVGLVVWTVFHPRAGGGGPRSS